MSQIVIIGGGPAGYEAALVAAQLDADVTVVEADGAGGACVLSDCVPSKTFIASSEVVTGYRHNEQFGIRSPGLEGVTRRREGGQRAGQAARAGAVRRHPVQADQGRGRPSSPAGPGSARTPSATPTRCSSPRPAVTRVPGRRVHRAGRHRRHPAGAAHRRTGRGAHPRLAPGVRPAGAARAPDRGRFRRDRRRVRQRVPGDGGAGDAGLQPGAGHAARGRRRGDGHRAGVPRPGHDDPQPVPGRLGAAPRRRRPGDALPTAVPSTARTR